MKDYIICPRCNIKRDWEVDPCPICAYHKSLPYAKKVYKGKTMSRKMWLHQIDAHKDIYVYTQALLNLYGVPEQTLLDHPEAFDMYLDLLKVYIE